MLRSHTCGELRIEHVGTEVTLSGWVQRIRDKGGLMWIDLRDRYGVTQLTFEEGKSKAEVIEQARELGREFVIQIKGTVVERYSKNDKIPTGQIEIDTTEIIVLNASHTPPFIIEDDTDGGEDLRMKYRYLDLRRNEVREKLALRSKLAIAVRNYLAEINFLEVETPVLIKSTPEGARDFVVPSRINPGEFYALPQSPQTFKQLLMVSGFDRYFQIVKCFRDEDLRADRQPEFTQIDCEMSFVTRDDVLGVFEGMTRHLFKSIKGVELNQFPHMTYADAMEKYGSDKPDIRFGMEFVNLNEVSQNKGFNVFDQAELVVGICAKGCAEYTRKQLDALTDFVRRPQVGAKGLVYVKCNADGSFKSSVDKFYGQEDLKAWADKAGAEAGDLILVLSGATNAVRKQMNELRLHLGNELGLRKSDEYEPLWVVDFPLLEWDEETERYHAMHHPFTSPLKEDLAKLETAPGEVRANAYDLVINGVEIGGGSIRIHDREMQKTMFKHLGFTDEEAKAQFGFLMDAFEYGAPPHGGIAFGFDRLCAMFGGTETIRDYIAFPKNTSGRDVMIDSPSPVANDQLKELGIKLS
ncbi:aspartate--tRNA ligase [Roseivirga sp. 4D4]|uniref:aspartate--tRNA ligase n=1 Tax=Roseivirga sp. 4D4 TaxID=1889784 RepID=UPI0008537871|nr:aspartate--tRNA ligase [Roseivirga sp. 4D4]OEK02458.1 aspartate--tRNA ligase [Roseivirga sp. 4D4]